MRFTMLRLNVICWIFSTFVCSRANGFANESDVLQIEVLLNGVAVLPCNMTPVKNDSVTLVIWYKNGSVPIYSVDMRGKGIPEFADHWSDDNIFGGRSKFQFQERSLIIEHLKRIDEGYYRCRVDYKTTPTTNFDVYLIVAVPVENVTILEAVLPKLATSGGNSASDGVLSESSEENSVFILPPLTEGSTLSATCISFGGNPLPKVIWKYKEEILDTTYENFPEKNQVRNTVRIENIQRYHSDNVITCSADNSELFRPTIVSALITIYLPPEEVRILGQNKPLSAGHRHEITCQVKGSRPPANITWWKGTEPLHGQSRYSISGDKSTSVSLLTFTPEVSDTGKSLTCITFNPILTETRLKDSWTLVVNYAPIVSLSLGSTLNASTIREGTDVYFECSVTAVPRVHKIQFLHDNRTVASSANEGIIISNQTLVMQSIKRTRAGYYICRAVNTEGETDSEPVFLDIKFEPVCRSNQQLVYGVSRNEEINITCLVDANPPADWFRWSFNNSMVHLKPLNNFTVINGTSVIGYRPSIELQYGTLLCSSKNDLGPQVVPCLFHIVSAGRPDSPYNCSIENKTQHSIQIKCVKGFDGGLPQQFVSEIRNAKDAKMISNVTSQLQPEFLIGGLEARTTYHIAVYAANRKGRSRKRIDFNVTTLPVSSQQHRRLSSGGSSKNVDSSFFKSDVGLKVTAGCAISASLILASVCYWTLKLIAKRKHRRRESTDDARLSITKCDTASSMPYAGVSVEEDNNPDLIPQNNTSSNTAMPYPLINSISVQTADYDFDSMPVWNSRQSHFISKSPKLLEPNKLEELVGWTTGNWQTTSEPIMLVIPEAIPMVPKQNAETQTTTTSPQNRKESAV